MAGFAPSDSGRAVLAAFWPFPEGGILPRDVGGRRLTTAIHVLPSSG
jgi:hypothetical protein